jgi:hypothetical protein
MKNKKRIVFEKLTSAESSKLVGGFSIAFGDNNPQDSTKKANNCHGANLKVGCGSHHHDTTGKSQKHYTNGNCKGNCVKSCGEKK